MLLVVFVDIIIIKKMYIYLLYWLPINWFITFTYNHEQRTISATVHIEGIWLQFNGYIIYNLDQRTISGTVHLEIFGFQIKIS